MNITEYNVRVLVFHLIFFVGVIWIFVDGINSVKSKILKIAMITILLLVLLALVFSLFASVSYRNVVTATGTIVDITHTGSFASLLDSYSFLIEQSDGNLIWYHTSIFAPFTFKKSMTQIAIGDHVSLYANNFFNVFYKCETISKHVKQ